MKRVMITAIVLLASFWHLQPAEAQWNTITGLEAEVIVHQGNGFGSSNTIVRRFSVVDLVVGSAITYADDSVYGASFLINVPGVYTIDYTDHRTDNAYPGFLYYIEIDHAPPQSTISAIIATPQLSSISTSTPNVIGKNSMTLLLDKGDVIRPWWWGNSGGTYDDASSQMIVTKVR